MENNSEDREYEDVIKDMRKDKMYSRLLAWIALAFAASGVLYGLMCTKARLYRSLRHYEPHMALQIILPIAVLLSLVGIVLLLAAGKRRVDKVRVPVTLSQTFAALCGVAGYFINRQNIGGHMTDFEALAKTYLGIWLIVAIVCTVFVLLAAKEEI
ncbi:MAG: hypothetical protein K2H45_11105 [Acetatifactor sp.]|nr:hypothetical protein [Acetatifactor sp.]